MKVGFPSDILGGAVFVGVATAYWFLAKSVNQTAFDDPTGPSGLPLIYAAALFLLGVWLCVGRVGKSFAAANARRSQRSGDWRAVALLLIAVGFVLTIGLLGYFLSVTWVLLAVLKLQGRQVSWRLTGSALSAAVLFHVLFALGLGVQLPGPDIVKAWF